MNDSKRSFSMEKLYKSIDSDRRYLRSWQRKQQAKKVLWSKLFFVVVQVRKDHPGMGLRSIWQMLKLEEVIGRDQFEYLALTSGLGLDFKPKYVSTTKGNGKRFLNKIKDIKLTDINQVWVSDITYYLLNDQFYYLTFILDLYSRKVIGYNVSDTLITEDTTIPALNYALKTRLNSCQVNDLIFHSDGGGQYYDHNFIELLRSHNIDSSMSASVYENAVIERFNRTIKSQYIKYYGPDSFLTLKKATMKACLNYNNKPHRALASRTPNEFESKLNYIG